MPLKLVEVNRKSARSRSEIVDFINSNLELGLPLEDEPLRLGKIIMFWAVEGRNRVGATGFYPKTPFLAESAKTVIAPEARGRGLGVTLSQAIEDEIKKRGYKKVTTSIYVTNLPMLFIKLKQGYIFEGLHRDHDRPGLHEYSLGKVLGKTKKLKARAKAKSKSATSTSKAKPKTARKVAKK